MSDFLLCSLYGPMASWGDIAVGEQRPSQGHPGKSSVIGLLAAALGIKRDEEKRHNELCDEIGYAVRIDSPGAMLRDYHTIQVPPPDRGRRYYTRKEEMSVDKDQMNTLLSSRDYRVDAHYTVALWNRNALYQLSELGSALKKPKFSLYLGRKSCPISRPLNPKIVSADSLFQAFNQYPVSDGFFDTKFLSASTAESIVTYAWEDLDINTAGFPAGNYMVKDRRDKISSRKRWQFLTRKEHYLTVKAGDI